MLYILSKYAVYLSPSSPIGSRPPSPKSDTEFETYQQFDAVSQTLLTGDDFETIDEIKWKWGELPESTPRTMKTEGSMDETRSGSIGTPVDRDYFAAHPHVYIVFCHSVRENTKNLKIVPKHREFSVLYVFKS